MPRFAVSFLFSTILALPNSAQIIHWGPVASTLSPADVNTAGALVVARNLHAAGTAVSPTVNGVTFTGGFAPSGWTNASTAAMNASTTGDAGYDALLDSARATSFGTPANPTGWGAIRIDNLASLNVGSNYIIQCWFTDQRTGTATNVLYDRVMTLSSAVGAATLSGGEVTNLAALSQGPLSGPMDADPDNNPAVGTPDLIFGTHCTGTFTRVNATDQLWLLVRGTHPLASNTLRPHLTAVQIRELPAGSFYATADAYGAGCGTPALALSTAQRPLVSTTFSVTTSNITPTTAFGAVAIGFTVFTPPLDLTVISMPGCFMYHDQVLTLPYTPAGGSATTNQNLPATLRLRFQLQALNFDPVARLTPLGLVTSNALDVITGNL
jgi:hypothetical protein